MGADGAGQQMAFRRAKSTGGNATAEQARAALVRAFEAADLDRSGMIGAYCTHSSDPELQHGVLPVPHLASRLALPLPLCSSSYVSVCLCKSHWLSIS